MSRIVLVGVFVGLIGATVPALAQELSQSSPFLGSWTKSQSLGCREYHDGLLTVERNAWNSHESSCEFAEISEGEESLTGRLVCSVEGEGYSVRLQARMQGRNTITVRTAVDDFDNGDAVFHRCSASSSAIAEPSVSFPSTPDEYLAAYRQLAADAASTRPAIVTETGFDPDALSAAIVSSLGIGGIPARPWITFEEWLAMIDRTGIVERYEPRFGVEDNQIFGLRAKPANSRSLEIIFRLDFDQVFLERLDDQPGQTQEADFLMVFLAGFNPRDYADGNVQALGTSEAEQSEDEITPGLDKLAGRWLSTRSGDSCATATGGVVEIDADRVMLGGQTCRITSFNPDVSDAAEQAGSLQCSGSGGAYSGRLFVFPDDADMISIAEDIPGDAYASNYERCG